MTEFEPLTSGFTNYRPMAEVEAEIRDNIGHDAYDAAARKLVADLAAIDNYHAHSLDGIRNEPLA